MCKILLEYCCCCQHFNGKVDDKDSFIMCIQFEKCIFTRYFYHESDYKCEDRCKNCPFNVPCSNKKMPISKSVHYIIDASFDYPPIND